MKFKLRIGSLVIMCCVLAGCTKRPPVTRTELVGSYIYKSEDPEDKPTDHEWDSLTLRADGKYDLIQGGPTKPKTETIGTWTLVSWGGIDNGPSLSLGHAGYPIEIARHEVRFLIDEDTGIWYVKVK